MNKAKEAKAIARLKQYTPPNGEKYWICYSGGKDIDEEVSQMLYDMGVQ